MAVLLSLRSELLGAELVIRNAVMAKNQWFWLIRGDATH
jgi:hypothetical protein